jgi:regulator of replication initiation timing
MELIMTGEYFSDTSIAHTNGRTAGRIVGEREGYERGYAQGKTDGFREGEAYGWDEAVRKGNAEMLKQQATTQNVVTEKEMLAEQLQSQRAQIESLRQTVAQLTDKNVKLKEENSGLVELVTTLKEANSHLQGKLTQIIADYKSFGQHYKDNLKFCKASAVFIESITSAVSEVAALDGEAGSILREKFTAEYSGRVRYAVRHGVMEKSPLEDPAYTKLVPETAEFINELIGSRPKISSELQPD